MTSSLKMGLKNDDSNNADRGSHRRSNRNSLVLNDDILSDGCFNKHSGSSRTAEVGDALDDYLDDNGYLTSKLLQRQQIQLVGPQRVHQHTPDSFFQNVASNIHKSYGSPENFTQPPCVESLSLYTHSPSTTPTRKTLASCYNGGYYDDVGGQEKGRPASGLDDCLADRTLWLRREQEIFLQTQRLKRMFRNLTLSFLQCMLVKRISVFYYFFLVLF